jgi:hypothetical protein
VKNYGVGPIFFLIFFLFTGCAMQWSRGHALREGATLKITEILRYFHNVRSLSQEELLYLYTLEEEQLAETDNDNNLLKFAILLTLPNTEFQDTSRALGLLDAYIMENRHPESLRNFAFFLSYMIYEKREQETLYGEVRKRLYNIIEDRDEKERLYQMAKQKIDNILSEKKYQESLYDELYQELNREKATTENLRKQIEQLKTIEKSINERKQPKDPAT